ncbi:alpha/beta hydrolase [Lactococcus garvieae]|uniref:alpha/beta hydrolase n=1 Tax=Lactococcus garvieae TaxID=1363 RepID=UPI00254FC42E|nr:alpha/beta hydrolase [Lactococcus garvieae]
MKKFFKVISLLLGFLVAVILGLVLVFNLSPRPGAFVINRLFAKSGGKITDQKTYEATKKKVLLKSDLSYTSDKKRNSFDIYMPQNSKGPVPVMIWVHGGAYVGGNKTDVKEFATRIAHDAQVAVICPNYALAPDAQYPSQIQQINELVQDLFSHQADYPSLDFNQIILGGDSAGAQIATQYAAIQTNKAYANALHFTPLLTKENLKGVISYCGPVNLQEKAHDKSNNLLLKAFTKTVAWSLLGTTDWKTNPHLQQASVVPAVTENYPPTYITDGNTLSFASEGEALTERLKALKVPVSQLFFSDSSKKIGHEYQFDYLTKEAQLCYQQTLQFIQEHTLQH